MSDEARARANRQERLDREEETARKRRESRPDPADDPDFASRLAAQDEEDEFAESEDELEL